jgi:hypothetical protein
MFNLGERVYFSVSATNHPFSYNYSYEPGMSTEFSLRDVVTCIQNAVKHRQIALGAFLHVEGPLTEPLLKL